MADASPHFDSLRRRFPTQLPDPERTKVLSETVDLTNSVEVISVPEAPFAQHVALALGTLYPDDRQNRDEKYLWIIRPDDVKAALEFGDLGLAQPTGRLTHTNLSGVSAYCGGEVYFEDEKRIWLNGGSGRFRPRSADEMQAVVEAFRNAGFLVRCPGWNAELMREYREFSLCKDDLWQ